MAVGDVGGGMSGWDVVFAPLSHIQNGGHDKLRAIAHCDGPCLFKTIGSLVNSLSVLMDSGPFLVMLWKQILNRAGSDRFLPHPFQTSTKPYAFEMESTALETQ